MQAAASRAGFLVPRSVRPLGLVQPHSRDLSTATSGISSGGPKPCSISQRTRLKIDADQTRTDVEVEAMAMAPVPTPEILWRKPPVLVLAALQGRHSAASASRRPRRRRRGPRRGRRPDAARRATAAMARLEPRRVRSHLDGECEWFVANDVLPTDVVTRNRRGAEAALRPWTPVFTHGDLQVADVFVDGDEVTGVVDWSDACQGDALFDLAILTLGHEEHLGDVVAGYGTDVDRELIRGWWSLRCLLGTRRRRAGLRAVMRDDNLDLLHVGHHRGGRRTSPGVSVETAHLTASAARRLMHATDRWRSSTASARRASTPESAIGVGSADPR